MEIKIKIEPNEIFFYPDKLIRKIKIKNLNEYSIKFELLTVLNEQDLSPLQANETQAIIEPEKQFTVSLEYKDSKDKDCDSIIILVIYKVIEDQIDLEPIHEPIHVPFHFRKVNLVSLDSKNLKNIYKNKFDDQSTDTESTKHSPDHSPFRKRFDNLFKSTKTKEKKFKDSQNEPNIGQANEVEIKLNDQLDKPKDQNLTLDDKLELNEAKKELKQISNQLNKRIKKEPIDTLNQDNLSVYSNLRNEDDNVCKLAKLIFLITFFNFCYTIFLAFFNPLNQLWNEIVDNYNLDSISAKCSSWLEFNKLFHNMTCFKKDNKI